jgi:hypothetical protein
MFAQTMLRSLFCTKQVALSYPRKAKSLVSGATTTFSS